LRSEQLRDRRDRLIEATLIHVVFDGWTEAALVAGARDLGLGREEARLAFPDGLGEAVLHFSDYADRLMQQELAERDLAALKIRERIALAVRCRLEVTAPWREAVRRTLSFFTLPIHAPLGAQATYRTVNAIWYAAGDKSTDFNFYTKRALLTGVYGATALYWLQDESEGRAETWAFLDRRIDDVMAIPRMTGKIKEALKL
jgi:ubiquinone biosynthesis protein COQ9